jgi:Kef-type K+ transport system membrane component KefB
VINIFSQITALLGLTVVVAWLAKLLRQPIIVAYILSGIAAGPLLFDIIHKEQELFNVFSQFGVILLLFVVGLSLNFNYIRKIGKAAVIGGLAQVIFTGLIGTGILIALDFSLMPAIYLAVAITFSSTIIITKLLSDKKQTDSLYGRHTIGLMLVQDVVAIILMILLTTRGGGGAALAESILRLLAYGAFLTAAVVLLSRYVLPAVLRRISDSTEFLFLFALAWCFGLTWAASQIGLSMEIGAVAAGIALGSSTYQSQISARITPLRDFFLIIFFILLGSEMDITSAGAAIMPGIILALFILIGNPLILYLVYRRMKFNRRNSMLVGLTAAQVSEFGFVLLFIGRELGHIGQVEISTFTMVAVATIFISSYLITYNERIFVFLRPLLSVFSKEKYHQHEEQSKVYDVWIIGYHRIGWSVVEALRGKERSFAVIDFDPNVIEQLQRERIPAYFLDIADATLLSELPLDKAQLIVSTIPNIENQISFIKHVRSHSSKPVIVANAPEAKYMQSLYEAGADYVMTPHLLGGKWIGHLIAVERVGRPEFEKLRHDQQLEIRAGLPVQIL